MDVLTSLEKELEQIIDPYVPPLVEREPPLITPTTKNATPEETPGVQRSSQVRVQNKQY